MEILVSLLTKLLPVIIALGLGLAIRRKGLLTADGIEALKSVVARITLPFVIFQAFYKMDYTAGTLITALAVFVICLMMFGLGFLLRRRLPGLTPLLPFTLAGYEMGMLGYPLFLLLAGAENMGFLAVADLGQVVFVFTVYLFALRRETGRARRPGEALREIIGNPVIIAVLLGLIVGLSGLGGLLAGSVAGQAVDAVCSFISAPTAVLILLAIGYDLKLQRGLLSRALRVIALRLIALLLVAGLMTLLLFALIPFEPMLLLALLMMFILPAPFVLPIYSQSEEEKKFVSVFLSLSTLLFVVLYAALMMLRPLFA